MRRLACGGVRPLLALLALAALLGSLSTTPPRRGTRQPVRFVRSEPSLALDPDSVVPGGAYEWQYHATHMDGVPGWVLHAAASVPVAVVDTGADLGAPDLQ